MAPLSTHIADILVSLEESVEALTEPQDSSLPVPMEAHDLPVVIGHAGQGVLENASTECPECGAPMVKRFRQDDQTPFWGCETYPKCRATRQYKVGFSPGYLLPQDVLIHFAGQSRTNPASVRDHEAWISRVLDMGSELFGNDAATNRWLDRPKISLRGKSPRSLMETVNGCCLVLFMLETYYDWDLTTTAVPR